MKGVILHALVPSVNALVLQQANNRAWMKSSGLRPSRKMPGTPIYHGQVVRQTWHGFRIIHTQAHRRPPQGTHRRVLLGKNKEESAEGRAQLLRRFS